MSLLGYTTKEIRDMSDGISKLYDTLTLKYGKSDAGVKCLANVGDLLDGLLSEGWTV